MAFLAHCEKIRGLSTNTVDAYGQDVTAFTEFFRQGNHDVGLDAQVVIQYLDHLKRDRNHKHTTIRRRLVTLRAFTMWLRKGGHIAADPFDELEIDLRPSKRLPRPADWVDVRTMLKADSGGIADTPNR